MSDFGASRSGVFPASLLGLRCAALIRLLQLLLLLLTTGVGVNYHHTKLKLFQLLHKLDTDGICNECSLSLAPDDENDSGGHIQYKISKLVLVPIPMCSSSKGLFG